jgi:hypothetical protein
MSKSKVQISNQIQSSIVKSIHDGIGPMEFVIPGLTEPAPYSIRGNPALFWIPAFAGMTPFALVNVDVYIHLEL